MFKNVQFESFVTGHRVMNSKLYLGVVLLANSCHSSFILDAVGLLNFIFIYRRHEFVLVLLVTEGHLERRPKGTKELNSDQTYMEASDSYIETELLSQNL